MQRCPRSVKWSVGSWLTAVAAGVLETAIHALTSEDYNAAVQLPVRAVVYVLVTAVIIQDAPTLAVINRRRTGTSEVAPLTAQETVR